MSGPEVEGKAWLDATAQVYAQCVDISFSSVAVAVLLEVLPEELS